MNKRCVSTGPMVEALEGRTLLSAGLTPDYLSYRVSTGKVLIDTNADRVADRKWFATQPGDQLTAGDFDGNTITDLAGYRNGVWSIDLNSDGGIDRQLHFGDALQTPLLGDLNGDGFADMILYNRSTGVWAADVTRDAVADPQAVPFFKFGGQVGDIALVGDMNGDGKDDPIIYRAGTWMIDFNRDGVSDLTFSLAGLPVGAPVVVNWGSDFRARAGVVINGQWHIDTDDNRVADVSMAFGSAGERPLTGFYDTSNSIFVKAGANGNGAINSPLGKISDAVARHQPGQIIRVAAGRYVENIVIYQKDELTIVGAGRNATKIAPASGDAMVVILGSNTWLYNMRFTGGGRGLIGLGSDIHARYISTENVMKDGLVTNNDGSPEGRATTLDVAFSNFDKAQVGYGVWLQGSTQAQIRKSTMSGNGTTPGLMGGAVNGRGLVISGSSVATVRQCTLTGNFDNNLSALDDSQATIRKSTMSFSKVGNGAMFLGNARVDIENSTFEHNGEIRDPSDLSKGRNGIEFFMDFRGPAARVVNNIFKDNTGFGIFVANGAGMTVSGNLFDNNFCGMGLEGSPGRNIQVSIVSNIFQVPVGSSYETAVFIQGPGATVTLGGAASALKNTFRNYASYRSVYVSPYAPGHIYEGYPHLTLANSDNIFVNSPSPIWYE